MENIEEKSEMIYKKLVDDYLTQYSLIQPLNMGLFNTLVSIANLAELWDLKIILIIAEKGTTSTEFVIDQLGTELSRSTLYRKLAHLIDKKVIFKDEDGLIKLDKKFKSLTLLGQLHQWNTSINIKK